MKETVQQRHSIMSIMPGLVAQQLPAPALTLRKDNVNVKKPPLATSLEDGMRSSSTRAVVPHTRTSNGVIKVSTASSAPVQSKIISSKRSGPTTLPATLPGDRKHQGATKSAAPRPSSSISTRSKPACGSSELRTSQNGLPRVPLKDRSNSATRLVRK